MLSELLLENATRDPVIGREVRDGLNTPSPMYPSTLVPAQSGPATPTSGGTAGRPSAAWRMKLTTAFTLGLFRSPVLGGAMSALWNFWSNRGSSTASVGSTLRSYCRHPWTRPSPASR